jgi:esterase/lipase superfamily enzyme
MELLVFGQSGTRMLVFPTRQQRFYEYEDRAMVHSLRHRVEAGKLQIICVDGLDDEALYAFDKQPEERIARQLAYERYIIEEVVPFTLKRNPRSPLIAHGCSLGAYQAVTIALRNPEHFARVVAFSGRYDLTLAVGDFFSLFDMYDGGPTLENLMPSLFVPKLTSGRTLRQMRKIRFTLVVGEEDPFCENNEALCTALKAHKIPCELHHWFGNAHRFRYWRQMARVYL